MTMEKRKPEAPNNMTPLDQSAEAGRAAKKKASETATSYEVRTNGVKSFRRCGIEFTAEPVEVDAADLTMDQRTELLNSDQLIVEEKGGGSAPPAKRDTQPHTRAKPEEK